MRILCALFLVAALAGCVGETVDGQTYTLTASGMPSLVGAGTTFAFTLDAAGDLDRESDHLGAHFWAATTSDPTGDFAMQAGACQHLADATDIVGSHTIVCTLDQTGTFYLRGHIRLEDDGKTFNYWSQEHAVRVVDYDLTTEGAASSATAGEDYTFTLHINGDSDVDSDHIGAHYWDEPVEDPTTAFAGQAGGCQHTGGGLPGSFQVTCNWQEPGEYTLHGHLRITSEGKASNFWSEAVTVTVS